MQLAGRDLFKTKVWSVLPDKIPDPIVGRNRDGPQIVHDHIYTGYKWLNYRKVDAKRHAVLQCV